VTLLSGEWDPLTPQVPQTAMRGALIQSVSVLALGKAGINASVAVRDCGGKNMQPSVKLH